MLQDLGVSDATTISMKNDDMIRLVKNPTTTTQVTHLRAINQNQQLFRFSDFVNLTHFSF